MVRVQLLAHAKYIKDRNALWEKNSIEKRKFTLYSTNFVIEISFRYLAMKILCQCLNNLKKLIVKKIGIENTKYSKRCYLN
jgi:hypothetical protein